MRATLSSLIRFIVCASLLVCLSSVAQAQFKASLQGTVMDQSGAVVPGTTVSVTNQETGRIQQVVASDSGFYRVTGLSPGRYRVSVEQPGFEKVAINVEVNAEETRGVDITLAPSRVAQEITVSAETETQLHTEDANVTRAITTEEIRRLPQVGRDPYELLRLTPGVFGDGARAGDGKSVALPNTTGPGGSNSSIFQIENQVPVSANGQRLSANDYQIDGVSVNSLGHGGAAVVTPNQESVKEILVESTSYSAEDGRNTGAQIKVVSQNGTNQFHSSAFIKYNSPDLNAFNKFGTIVNPSPVRVEQLFRQFGGSIGGPIIKNKVFFFFSYEGLRNNSTNFDDKFVETPQFRQLVINQRPGSVTSKVFQSAGIEPRILQVLPAKCDNFISRNQPCSVVSGGLDIGSLTGGSGQYVSLGNPSGGGLDGVPDIQLVRLALPNRFSGNQYNARIDFDHGNDRFAVSTYFTHNTSVGSDVGEQSRPIGDITSTPLNSAATVTWIRTISPMMLNEARANFTRFAFNEVESSIATNFGIPRIEVEGLHLSPEGERIRFGANRTETTPGILAQNTFEVRDTLSKVIGNHVLKFGVEIRREQDNSSLVGGARPDYSFSGLFNLANGTPIFEAINADPSSGLPADAQRYFRTTDYGFFVQHDWKVRPNLLLTTGLRYEYFTPLREKQGRIPRLVFPAGNLASSKIVVSDQLFDPDRNNFAPRLGFAWSPAHFKSKAVLRGGFGIGYNRVPGVNFSNVRGNPPFFARYNICCGTASTDFGTPFVGGQILYALGSSPSPFSYPINPVLAQGIDPVTGGVRGSTVEIWGTDPNFRNAYVYNFSLEAEYQLPYHLVASLGYQGSSSHKLIRITDATLLFTPNPAFDPVFFLRPDVNANYNAMIARLTHNFAQGFRLDAIYRWSKSIDTLSFEGPGAVTNQTFPADLRSERGPSDFDVTHNLILSGIWDLPIFRGRNDWIGKVLGGWQVNGILTAHSGFPWTPKISQSLRQPSGKFFGPIRPTQYFGGAGSDTSIDAFLTGSNFPGGGSKFFNTSVAGDPPTFALNPPGIGRNSFRGPRYSSVDLSFMKETGLPRIPGLGEDAKLELRFNFFNAFNKLNLTPIGFFDSGAFVTDSNFGRSTAGLSGRVIELQARFSF